MVAKPHSPRWLLFDDANEPVCNFIPAVVVCQQMLTPSGENYQTRIKLSLKFADGSNIETTVDMSDLDRLIWSELDYRCILNSNYRNARGYITNIIRAGLCEAPVETVYHLDRTGIFHLDSTVIFAVGDRVIARSPTAGVIPSIELGQTGFQLDIDPELSVTDAFRGMQELISLSPEIGRVLVAHVISGITRAAFKEAGLTPCAVLVIMGRSGMLKSSYVPHLVQLYNRKGRIGPVTRFNSTKRFIEESLYNYSECTAVIDDLHTAESSSIKRRNEETAEEIIRRIGDDTGRGRMEGYTQEQCQFRGNAVFIGEYTIGKASTIPRALVVKLTSPPNGAILDKYQRHQPLIVSTFYFHFIQWYVDHFTEICSKIDTMLTQFRQTAANSKTHGRLRDTLFYLQLSYMLLLEFCADSQCCSKQDAADEYGKFNTYLNRLIQTQQAWFDRDSSAEPTDYLALIRTLYQSGSFCLAKDKKHFNPAWHDGLIYYGCLCLRGESIRNRLGQFVPRFNFNDCINSLRNTGALKLVGQKHTVQIDGTGGKRFYAVRI